MRVPGDSIVTYVFIEIPESARNVTVTVFPAEVSREYKINIRAYLQLFF